MGAFRASRQFCEGSAHTLSQLTLSVMNFFNTHCGDIGQLSTYEVGHLHFISQCSVLALPFDF